MKMRVFIFLAVAVCTYAVDIKETENSAHNAEKRQTQEGTPTHLLYRPANKQEQVAPVEEPQEYDKGQGNRTSPLPSSETQTTNVDRKTREPSNPPSTEQTTTALPKHDHEDLKEKQVNVEVVNDQPQLQSTDPITVEHRAQSVEDRMKESIPPPPRDGKSYTPEEFTSLVVSGYAVTPIPDFGGPGGFGAVSPSFINAGTPIPESFTPTPIYYNQNLGVSNTLGQPLAPPLLPLPHPSLRIDPSRIMQHFKHSLETLPLPRNGKFFTPEEFDGLIAAGYPVAAVPVNAHTYGVPSRLETEEYRPGQVFSLNAQELLELQPERKAPLASGQLLQQLYVNPQQEHKQNLQQIYYLDPQTGRQVPPSHAVIARPHFSFNGGEASVGAALSVSDTGASSTDTFDQELLALLGQTQVRPESQTYSPAPTSTVRSVAPQYQQVSGYVSKPSKKSSKLRSKVHVSFPQTTEAPQQYLIETTNVQQQQQRLQQQPQYRPTAQPQRLAQALRYVPIASAQQQQEFAYESPEPQGLKIVPAPKLQQFRPQPNFRVAPQQYQQQEAQPKHYRLVEVPSQQERAQPIRQELRLPSSNIERPLAYLKRFSEQEKQRSVKIYDPVPENAPQQPTQQLYGEQFVLRPIYRTNEQQRQKYDAQVKNERVIDSTKTPHSAIYVSKNLPVPRKLRPQPSLREQADIEQVNIEQYGRNLDEQRSLLPPPRNNKAYTPEEFAGLVAAGYSVTPVPVHAANLEGAQSRILEETVTLQPKRRQTPRRRNQYLPVRDDAP